VPNIHDFQQAAAARINSFIANTIQKRKRLAQGTEFENYLLEHQLSKGKNFITDVRFIVRDTTSY
jgi:hypothetical protein